MINAEENEQLCRVGKGTLMGNFFRQFWLPACMSSELKADGDPMRLMLLGEKLVAFRDTEGRVGVFDHRCPHRCASLFFGRNELGGIRCAYHGWKFDVTGKCLDQPNLEDKSKYPAGTPAYAYKTVESGGLVFVYMGEREVAPPLPELEAIMGEGDDRNIALTHRDCNYMQALEGDIDTSHLGFLHVGGVDGERLDMSDPEVFTVTEKAPKINVSVMPFGTMYSAQRNAYEGTEHHRFASYIFPFWVTYPSGSMDDNVTANAWVPIDDVSTMIFNIDLGRAKGRKKNLHYKDGTPVPHLQRPLEYLPDHHRLEGPLAAGQGCLERLRHRPRHAAERRELYRRRRHPAPGPDDPGEHGPDRRPHHGAPRGERPHGHPHPPGDARRGARLCRDRQAPRRGRQARALPRRPRRRHRRPLRHRLARRLRGEDGRDQGAQAVPQRG